MRPSSGSKAHSIFSAIFIALFALFLSACAGDACKDVACSGHGVCAVTGNDAVCVCSEGYRADGLSCIARPVCGSRACGTDGNGNSCGTCSSGLTCSAAGQCVPVLNCGSRVCGNDGNGNSCGTCASGLTCSAAGQCVPVLNCGSRVCGNDGNGNSCGTCASGLTCSAGQCVPVSNCGSRVCGTDGNGNSCGTCASGLTCSAGQCVASSASLRLVNNSAIIISYLYVRPSGQSNWGPDQLGSNVVAPGQSFTLNGIPCPGNYDLKVTNLDASKFATHLGYAFQCGATLTWTINN